MSIKFSEAAKRLLTVRQWENGSKLTPHRDLTVTYKTIVLKSKTHPDIIFVFCCPNIQMNDICFVIGRLTQAGPHGKLHSRLSQHLCCTMKSADEA